jgi:hypothetical protein
MEFLQPTEIQARCAALRLHPREVAALASCHHNTVRGILRGAGAQGRTLARVFAAIEGEELRLRNYLLALHPVKQEERTA